MYIRPSKNFLFPVLQKELSKVKGGIGLDAASAGMKNRHMFKTDIYIGFDLNQTLLEAGLEKYKDSKTIGLHGDITNLSGIPSNSVDMVTSTNTLYVLAPEERLAAISELSRITAPKGKLVCEMLLTESFDSELELLQNNFNGIEKIYYKNFISGAYERFFERNSNLGAHPIAGLLPFRMFSWLVSRLEYLTGSFRTLNHHVLLICQNKKASGQRQEFNLKNLKKISDRLYSIL